MPEVSYVPGAMTAVVGDGCLALVDGPPDSPAVALIWQHFAQQARANAILGALLAAGFAGAESFVLLGRGQDDQLRLFCRGTVGATALGGAVPAWFDGAGLSTWSEHLIGDDVTRVVVGEPTADRPWCLPASAGVLLAECVIADLTAPAPADGTPRLAAGVSGTGLFATDGEFPDVEALRTIRKRSKAAPLVPSDELPAGEFSDAFPSGEFSGPGFSGAESAGGGVPAEELPGHVSGGEFPGHELSGDAFPGRESAGDQFAGDEVPVGEFSAEPVSAGGLPAGEVAPAGGSAGDELPAGRTAADPPPAAVPHDPDTITMPEPGHGSVAGSVADIVRRAEPSAPGLAGPAGELIESVPWATSGRDELAGPVGPPAPPAPPDRIGPLVSSLVCPNGHANPPSGGACRWCGAPLPLDPVLIPRPVLGVLRLSVGDVITLDRGVVMGRNPSADFDAADSDDERPHVVKLPSDDGDISRTHLKVTLDGWHVLVTDLNSTNGTLVALPGREPEQLRPGQPLPILPGTIVILPEGIEFRYELTG